MPRPFNHLQEFMHRDSMIAQLEDHGCAPWDVAVIGGGATGLGVAIDSAARGYKTVLVERGDFAQGTSSRSTKLIHGCLRYLQKGNVSLALRAMREREILRRNAPHLVHDLPFVIPTYDWWEPWFYGFGMRLYDRLGGRHSFGHARNLSRSETVSHLPTIATEGLRGGVVYHDGQFDDARLAINLAATAVAQGAVLLNYMSASRLLVENGAVRGVMVEDRERGAEFTLRSRVVINATGPFCDTVRRMEDDTTVAMVRPSQGVHIVLPGEFLPGNSAVVVPKTPDGRTLFAIPWHGCVVAGTTDTPIADTPEEPRALAEETTFILTNVARYLTNAPTAEHVRSVFAGVRPLVCGEAGKNPDSISRDHLLTVSKGGLVTITGGKWTTYRRMAMETVDVAARTGELAPRPCTTATLAIHGHCADIGPYNGLGVYGTDAPAVEALAQENGAWRDRIHPELGISAAQVVWAVRHEMARTVEDVLARRTRALLLHARASMDAAPAVARLMAPLLGQDAAWESAQVDSYRALARGYLLDG